MQSSAITVTLHIWDDHTFKPLSIFNCCLWATVEPASSHYESCQCCNSNKPWSVFYTVTYWILELGELGLESPWIRCLRKCGNPVMFWEHVFNLPQDTLWSIKFTERDWLFKSLNNFTVGYIKCQLSTSLRYDLRDVEGQCLMPYQHTYHSSS